MNIRCSTSKICAATVYTKGVFSDCLQKHISSVYYSEMGILKAIVNSYGMGLERKGRCLSVSIFLCHCSVL